MDKKVILATTLLIGFFSCAVATGAGAAKDYPVQPVSFTDVRIEDGFWTPRMETNRKVTIPYAFKKCEETGRISNFAKAGGLMEGKFEGKYFNDSDVYKVIEGAAYSLKIHPDAELERYVDGVIDKIAATQWKDGYLYTFYSLPSRQPEKRWSDVRSKHELYCAGHFFEAAVAYYQATGKRKILDVAVRLADYIDSVFGAGKRTDPPGHQEIEIGLAKLYRATGDAKYLKLAKFFLDERGYAHGGRKLYGEYSQDHKPVVEQDEAVGHAVRAGYMYSGMADVGALTNDTDYIKTTNGIWENVVSKKLYITGGIGARHKGEAFGDSYELPNKTAYCETCAAIANALWNHRLFLLHGDAKYIDVLERVIYNGFLSGVSLGGDKFFYPNPLASDGKERRPWFGCACCPTNIVRFIPSIAGYAYAQKDDTVYVNLFIGGSARVNVGNNTVALRQETGYPWNGVVWIAVEPERSEKFSIYVRIPGWARGEPVPSDLYRYATESNERVTLKVNGKDVGLDIEKGFARIRRRWNEGDKIELHLPMPVRRVICNEKVRENRGKVAMERGPIVYCVEWVDNGGKVSRIKVSNDDEFDVTYTNELGGLNVIKGRKSGFLAIPYYAWAHRGEGEMAVWLPGDASKAKPTRAAILKADSFKHYVEKFNKNDVEYFPPSIPNEQAWEFMKANIPLLECPDKDIEEIYYFRWWSYRKHIKDTNDGFVIDEFRPKVSWSGKHNTISCAAAHHIYEGRWLHDVKYMDDYEVFWLRNEGAIPRRYSFWAADAYYARYLVQLNKKHIVELLDDLIGNYKGWEKERLLDDGLFWQYDVLDGMEESVSGSRRHKKARPTINSYMYGDARAISKIGEMAGRGDVAKKYAGKAAKLKKLVQDSLWDKEANFFKVRHENGKLSDAREAIGFVPWYFNLPDAGYEEAWKQLMDPKGFYAPFGPTTAEQRHPGFIIAYTGDDCQWNGPSWPYSTSQTLVALANVLNKYKQDFIAKEDYLETLKIYTKSHRLRFDDGRVVPWIDENLDPYTGQWLARLRKLDSPNVNTSKRGKDYNHSSYCDLIISGLVGLRPRADDIVEVNPLVPKDTWGWFCLDKVLYHGRTITILWDKNGTKYGKGTGLRVYADGEEIARSDTLGRVTGSLVK